MKIDKSCDVTPDMVMDALEEHNIETRPIWKPMHLQPVFADCDFITASGSKAQEGDLPSIAEEVFDTGLCLPSDIKNTSEDMELIIRIIRKCFGRV